MVLFFKSSPYNLFWLFPVSYLLGIFSLVPPFSLLWYPANLFGKFCCIGLNKDEVKRNIKKVSTYREMIRDGINPNQAKRN
jgi:hypothetical protein